MLQASAELRAVADAAWALGGTISGVPVERQTMWQAIKPRDGKAYWWAAFRSEGEAIEALRLPE